jgi:hypothetical protein
MWFTMTSSRVAASLMAETQDGSCECQTIYIRNDPVERDGRRTQSVATNKLAICLGIVDLRV